MNFLHLVLPVLVSLNPAVLNYAGYWGSYWGIINGLDWGVKLLRGEKELDTKQFLASLKSDK